MLLAGPGASPDAHAVPWCEIEFLSGFDIEGPIPGINVADGISPILSRRVRIRHHLLAQRSLSNLRCVVLAEGDEELLVAGETVLYGRRLACERSPISVIGCRKASNIGDVLGQCLLAVHREVRERPVSVILDREFC